MKRVQEGIRNEGRRAVFMGDMAASGSIYTSAPAELTGTPAISIRYLYVKRAVDIGLSLLVIPVFFLPGLIIAAAILLTSPGGVFYREQRIGRNGRVGGTPAALAPSGNSGTGGTGSGSPLSSESRT